MKRYRKKANRGFSLLELMVVLCLLTLLTAVGVPSFTQLLNKTRQQAAIENLQTHLALARLQAVTQRQWITVCHSHDGVRCVGDSRKGKTNWHALIMFVDVHKNRQLADVRYLLRVDTFDDSVAIQWNRGDSLTYQPDGSVSGSSNGTFSIHGGSQLHETRLIVAMSGRVRMER